MRVKPISVLVLGIFICQAQSPITTNVETKPSLPNNPHPHRLGETFKEWLLAENSSVNSICAEKDNKKACNTLKDIRFNKRGNFLDASGITWKFSDGRLMGTDPVGAIGSGMKIYIQPQNGFESYISAAFFKKHVPATITQNQEEAQFTLTSVVLAREESGLGKIARCAFLYCIGIEGIQTATVELISPAKEVVWAYNVRKSGAHSYQSTAEAIAKHLLAEVFDKYNKQLLGY